MPAFLVRQGSVKLMSIIDTGMLPILVLVFIIIFPELPFMIKILSFMFIQRNRVISLYCELRKESDFLKHIKTLFELQNRKRIES